MEFLLALLGGAFFLGKYMKHTAAENAYYQSESSRDRRRAELAAKYNISSEDYRRLNSYRQRNPEEFYKFIEEDCEYIFGKDWKFETRPNSYANRWHWFQMLYLAKYGKINLLDLTMGIPTGSSTHEYKFLRYALRLEELLKKSGTDIELAIDYVDLKHAPFSYDRLRQCTIREKRLCCGTPYDIRTIMPLLPITPEQANTLNKRDKIDRYIRVKSESFLKSVTPDERKDFRRKMRNTKNIDILCEQLRKYPDSRFIMCFADNFEEYITNPGRYDEQELYGEMMSLSYALSGVTDRHNLVYRIIHADAEHYADPNFWLASNKLERAIIEIIRSVRSDGWLLTVSKKVWEEEAEKAVYSNK